MTKTDTSSASHKKGKKKNKNSLEDVMDAAEILAKLDEDENPTVTNDPVKVTEDVDDITTIPQLQSAPLSEQEPEIRIKSKKEKERERKERQKETRKQQQKSHKPLPVDNKPEDNSQDQTVNDTPKIVNEEPVLKKTEPVKKKEKGKSAAAELIRKRLAAQKAAQEEAERLAAEELKKIEEEEQRIREEQERKDQAKQLKKLKEKEKKEQLKKEGKYMTKSQKEAQHRQQLRLNQLLQAPGNSVKAFQEKAKTSSSQSENPIKMKPLPVQKPSHLSEPIAEKTEPIKIEPAEPKDCVKDSWDLDSESEGNVEDEQESVTNIENLPPSQPNEYTALNEIKREPAADENKTKKILPVSKETFQEPAENNSELRSPICCILGHVDTGKTKLLDKVRQTNVQGGEAGGITQQIGATYFPTSSISLKTTKVASIDPFAYELPGLLIIDTPGHESFTNLRSRGSSLCNIAILVVDIMHGLEPQTMESLGLLRNGKIPFVVALNKVDRLFEWKSVPDNDFRSSLGAQSKSVVTEFQSRLSHIVVQLQEQGLNSCLYYENKNFAKNVSIVPTSAVTGEGVPDLLHLLMKLTQMRMSTSLRFLSKVECTVLEVKVIQGLGTTIDVILVNGTLHEGDKIVLCGMNGAITTNIRALLTPPPLQELRVQGSYISHKSIKAAMGIKISANNLDSAIAGSRLLVIGPGDDENALMKDVMMDLDYFFSMVDKTGTGVYVQTSTLGSLEAFLTFLKSSNIPVSGFNIGPVHKKDVMKAGAILERSPEYAQILAFDVKIEKEAQELADSMNVKIFTADIIYHLFDSYTKFMKDVEDERRREQAPQAVFPCILRMVPDCVFSSRNPIIIGVDVVEGHLRLGTPLCLVKNGTTISLGKVTGIEHNKKAKEIVRRGEPSVAVKIESGIHEPHRLYGRHFTESDEIISQLSRQSVDILKASFREELKKDKEWPLVTKLMAKLGISRLQ